MACSPPGWMGIHLVTSRASPFTMTQASSFLLCLATSSGVRPPPPPAAAAGAPPPPPPILPFMVRCWAFFSTVPGLWIIFHSSVASFPRYAMIACSPPGWMEIHLVTSMASPFTTTQASSFLLCLATSSMVTPGGPASATGAAAGRDSRSLQYASSSSRVISSGFLLGFSSFFSSALATADSSMSFSLAPKAVAAVMPAMRPE
mmetsp:Transcript_77307/g.170758  ORF Transcript_77307/g.170758 Transcript_77307/m.170758 type:complete len:203 (-) Transcript_77307:1285-1893(-)